MSHVTEAEARDLVAALSGAKGMEVAEAEGAIEKLLMVGAEPDADAF